MKRILSAVLIMISLGAVAQQSKRNEVAIKSLEDEKDPEARLAKAKLLETGSEEDLQAAIDFYYMRDRKISDHFRGIAIKRFPKGQNAYLKWETVMYYENDAKTRERMLSQFKKEFPGHTFDRANNYVASAYATEKNITKTKDYLSQIQNLTTRSMTIQEIAEIVMKYDLATAKSMVKNEIDRLNTAGNSNEDVRYQQMGRRTYFNFIDQYARILTAENNYGEAIKFSKESFDSIGQRTPPVKVTYGFLLAKTGQYEKALPLLKEVITAGYGTAEIKTALKESYQKTYPGKDATAYVAEIEGRQKTKIRDEVAMKLINEPSPNFILKDVNGKEVALADFRGKTIVLDFWATWCIPCKKAFPLMDMTRKKYENDPDVKFLFIHTFDKAADPLTDAKTYLTRNNYPFDLYMDYRNKETDSCMVANALKVTAIPTKFVLDRNGNIRFRTTGLYGGDEAASAELSAVIDMVKNL